MPFNGSGTFVYTVNTVVPDAVPSTTIVSDDFDQFSADVSTALSLCQTTDGQSVISATIPMATYRHTGVGDATALTDYASANQVIDNTLPYGGASAAGTDTYAVNLTISPGAYVAGNRFQFLTDVANTGACTLNINSLGAKSIKLANGNDPHTGALPINSAVDVLYDGTNLILLNPFFTGVESLVTKTELDILDGATLTTTELNYVDGVTSDIQTQIDSKANILRVVKTADNAAVNNSVSLVNDDHLVISSIPTGYYDLELFLYVTTNSTADFRVAFSTTGTIADDWLEAVIYSDADVSTHYHVKTDVASNTSLSGCGTNNSITIKGTLNVTVTGNLQFRYAQGTAAVVDTITKKGSFMKLTKVN